MGFDISVCEVAFREGNAIIKSVLTEDYLSYNWSDLSKICLTHISEKCTCEGKTELWYFRSDCHGRRGDDVEKRAGTALELLKTHGIHSGTPELTNLSWAWGVHDQTPLAQKNRLEIFAYHLKRFQDLGHQYPEAFFVGDIDGGIVLPDGQEFPIVKDTECSDEDEEEQGPVTYFRHPFKGNFRVDSFKTAMEVYGLCSAMGEPTANNWYKFAMMMPDVPKFI